MYPGRAGGTFSREGVATGISASDRVVINGLFRLRPGTPVAPNSVAMEKES